jgi:hypothetical protein
MKRKASPPAAGVALDKDFRRDRFGHNNVGAEPHLSRITYLASAKGYVMARRPGATPFVIPAALWSSFPLFQEWRKTGAAIEAVADADRTDAALATIAHRPRTKAHTSAPVHPSAAVVPCGVADAQGWSCCGKPANCSRTGRPPRLSQLHRGAFARYCQQHEMTFDQAEAGSPRAL